MSRWGHFEGHVVVEWIDHDGDDRAMRLVEDFGYVDRQGRKWLARAGNVIDGASIPRFFWRFVGPPFVGDYRRASVIHDVACQRKAAPSSQVHRMFYEACRAGGCNALAARTLYNAVRMFGPRF